MILMAGVIAVSLKIVGVMLITALLIIPAAAARRLLDRGSLLARCPLLGVVPPAKVSASDLCVVVSSMTISVASFKAVLAVFSATIFAVSTVSAKGVSMSSAAG